MAAQKLTMDRKDDKDTSLVTIKGIIDEDASFEQAFINLKANTTINLEGVDLINSCGVREWIHAVAKIPADVKIRYAQCATRIIEQINYVANFLGSGTVVSFHAPYFCPKCKTEVDILLTVEDVLKNQPVRAPDQTCPKCGGPLDFDDIEEEFFAFLEKK